MPCSCSAHALLIVLSYRLNAFLIPSLSDALLFTHYFFTCSSLVLHSFPTCSPLEPRSFLLENSCAILLFEFMVYEISVSATKVRLYFDIASQKWKKIQIFAYNSRLEFVGKEKPDYLNAKKLK